MKGEWGLDFVWDDNITHMADIIYYIFDNYVCRFGIQVGYNGKEVMWKCEN